MIKITKKWRLKLVVTLKKNLSKESQPLSLPKPFSGLSKPKAPPPPPKKKIISSKLVMIILWCSRVFPIFMGLIGPKNKQKLLKLTCKTTLDIGALCGTLSADSASP